MILSLNFFLFFLKNNSCNEKEINCHAVADKSCWEGILACAATVFACATAATWIGMIPCALGAAVCVTKFKDCLDGFDCDDKVQASVEKCIEKKDECCYHC